MPWHWNAVACAALLLAAPAAPRAEDSNPPSAVPLDKLLTLPSSVELSAPRYGGATRSEWRARFDEARAERARAQTALDKARAELEKKAANTEQWQMQAPGLGGNVSSGGDTGPLSYRLRQEIRRQRDEIEHADRRLQELTVEARLAGVPEEWTQPEEAPPSGAGVEPAPSPGQEGEGR